MSTAYNRVVYEGLESDGNYITHTNDATYKLVIKEKDLYELANANGNNHTFESNDVDITVKLTKDEDNKNYIQNFIFVNISNLLTIIKYVCKLGI